VPPPDLDGTDAASAYARSLLVGELVRLRELRSADLLQLDRWWADPGLQIFQTTRVDAGVEGSTESMFRAWSANDNLGTAAFSIERLADASLVGHVSLWGADPKNRDAKLGILLGTEFLGERLGSDAVRVVVRYAFVEMGLHRVTLQVYAFNTRAVAAYRRVGFVEEGRARRAVWHAGRWYDEVSMGIVADEWSDTSDG